MNLCNVNLILKNFQSKLRETQNIQEKRNKTNSINLRFFQGNLNNTGKES